MRAATSRDTSLIAWDRLRETGRIQPQEQAILRALYLSLGQAMTRAELAAAAGIRHSSACGRVKALLDVGILEELPRRRCRVTGESAHPVRLAPSQGALFGRAA